MKWFLTLIIALLPLAAQSAWIDSTGKPIPDNESMRSVGDFGVQIVLTADEGKFRQTWNESKVSPKLSTVNTARPGKAVSAMLIFHGCTPNAEGVCDVVAEFVIEGPDGDRTPAGGGPVWSEKPMQPRFAQLGRASLTVGFGPTDPMGEVKIIANVKDKISGRELSLVARLKVVK